jgi:hypothetical protein
MEESIKALLESAIAETGADLATSVDEVALYAAERTAVLAMHVGQPGFDLAVIAERDSVALMAAMNATGAANAVRQRILGVIQGALWLGAQQLANRAASADADEAPL